MYLGIDPGLRTLSWCLCDDEKIVEVGTVDLLKGVPRGMHKQYAWLVWNWMKDHKRLFRADTIGIEMQMNQKMKIIQTALQCLGAIDRTVLIAPIRWRKYHGISKGNYRQNKKASVAKAQKLPLPQKVKKLFASKKKKDDIAEAILIAIYTRTL